MISLFGDVDPDAKIKRRWDPIKYPEPFVYLMLFVKTELRNLSVSKENRRSDRDVDDDALITTETAEALLLEAGGRCRPLQAAVRRLYELLVDEIGDDEPLQSSCRRPHVGRYVQKPQVLTERLLYVRQGHQQFEEADAHRRESGAGASGEGTHS